MLRCIDQKSIDPLSSTSKVLTPETVGDAHYECAQKVIAILQKYKDLQDIIAILGMDELSEEDKLVVGRSPSNTPPRTHEKPTKRNEHIETNHQNVQRGAEPAKHRQPLEHFAQYC